MNMTKNDTRTFWNTRSKSFPGHKDGETYQAKMVETAINMGVNFLNKDVMDLGCGSGAYTLRIARDAKHVTALDISHGMLEKVATDAAKIGAKNVTILESDWLDYEPNKHFDIIFCSLTPAIGTIEALEKLNLCKGSQIVVIAFVKPIKAYVLEELFASHNAQYGKCKSDRLVREWLESKDIPFASTRVLGEWTTIRTHQETIENCTHVLEAHSVTPNMETIKNLSENYRTAEGLYESRTAYDVEMMVWEVR